MRVLVFGPTSYVADAFVAECVRRGWDVVVDIRDPVRWEILGKRQAHVIPVESGGAWRGSVDVAINFAYIKEARWYEFHRLTRQLIHRFLSTARRMSARIVVQVSSQAVFGYRFASSPTPAPPPRNAGDSYIEGKALAARMVLADARDGAYIPVILRLGNVVGPGAVPWTATLATHLLLGKPVGTGRSNATYIGNVVDYLCHVVQSEETLKGFGPFHHLAEFSAVSWREIIDPMCTVMGITPCYAVVSDRSGSDVSWSSRVKSYARYIAGVCPPRVSKALGELVTCFRSYLSFTATTLTAGGEGLAQVMGEKFEFRSHVLPSWKPPFDFGLAMELICRWLTEAGYVRQCC